MNYLIYYNFLLEKIIFALENKYIFFFIILVAKTWNGNKYRQLTILQGKLSSKDLKQDLAFMEYLLQLTVINCAKKLLNFLI